MMKTGIIYLILSIQLINLLHPVESISAKTADKRGVPSDVKYIKCGTCSEISKAVVEKLQAKNVREVTELSVLDSVEAICEPESDHGAWMKKLDMVEHSNEIKLELQEGVQKCQRECQTIALACRQVVSTVETELAEYVYKQIKNGSLDEKDVEKWLCDKRSGVSSACRYQHVAVPKDREPGPSFEPIDEKQARLDSLMSQMKGEGGGDMPDLSMYSRDDIMSRFNANKDDDDDDDDDEEEEKKKKENNIDMSDKTVGEENNDDMMNDIDSVGKPKVDLAAGIKVGSDEL